MGILDSVRRPSYNSSCKEQNIDVAMILQRRGEEQIIKGVWIEEADGTGPLSIPTIRWRDLVLGDLRTLGSELGMVKTGMSGGTWLTRLKSI